MKHLMLAACVTLGCSPALAQNARPVHVEGTWQADSNNYWTRDNDERWVSIQLRHDDSSTGIGLPARDVPALADRGADGSLHFVVRRDAGAFTFDGRLAGGDAHGTFHFDGSPDFLTTMSKLGYANLSGDDVLRFALHDIDGAYVTGFRNAGYHPDVDELVKTRIHGATPGFAQDVKQQGLGTPSIDDLVKMRIHGITPEFIKGLRDAGYRNLSIDDLVKARIHGVTPEFVKQLADLGYRNLALEDLVKLRIHGVTPDYIKQMRDAGYGGVQADKLVTFRIHGVDADFVHRAQAHGFTNLSADDLVELKIHAGRWMTSE